MPLTQDRNTPYQDAQCIDVPVAAASHVYAGAMVAANAAGFAVPASTATGLAYLGRAEHAADNSAGGNGDMQLAVRRGKAFCWANDGSDPVTQASLGRVCYMVDDQSVAATDGTGTRSPAGIVVGIDSNGVWVE